MAILATLKAAEPELVRMTVCGLAVVPTPWLPKSMLFGESFAACSPVETSSVRVAVPVPAVFVALSVTFESPAEVGVPEMSPVVLLTESPAGNPEAP
jgi:hypothetical protein